MLRRVAAKAELSYLAMNVNNGRIKSGRPDAGQQGRSEVSVRPSFVLGTKIEGRGSVLTRLDRCAAAITGGRRAPAAGHQAALGDSGSLRTGVVLSASLYLRDRDSEAAVMQ